MKEEKVPPSPHFPVGASVFWSWQGRSIRGTVRAVYHERIERMIKGKRIVRNGSAERPAYLVESEAGNEALKLATELRAGGEPIKGTPLPWMTRRRNQK